MDTLESIFIFLFYFHSSFFAEERRIRKKRRRPELKGTHTSFFKYSMNSLCSNSISYLVAQPKVETRYNQKNLHAFQPFRAKCRHKTLRLWIIKFWLGFLQAQSAVLFSQSMLLSLAIVQRKRFGRWKLVFISPKAVSCIDAKGITMLWDVFLVFFYSNRKKNETQIFFWKSKIVSSFGKIILAQVFFSYYICTDKSMLRHD